jgi:SAM-dependent methyltransferase
MSITLDLGCGVRKIAGTFGADVRPLAGIDIVCDLARIPYPFGTGSVDEVHLSHVLEHLDNPVAVLAEIWRILKQDGRLHIRVPHYTGTFAWKDPTHRRCFSSESFDYFGVNPYSYYTSARFDVESVRLRYFMQPPGRRVSRVWGLMVQRLLDAHPTFGERHVAYLVGGIDEIEVHLRAVKTSDQEVQTLCRR